MSAARRASSVLDSSLHGSAAQHFRAVSPLGGIRQFWHRAQPLVDGLSRAVCTVQRNFRNYNNLTSHRWYLLLQVIVDSVVGSVVKRSELVELLRLHIFNHVVQLSGNGGQFYRQHMVL